MKKYQCSKCGYIYDPRRGRPREDIPPNTPFSELPDHWVCPFCGAPKEQFYPLEPHTQ